MRENKPRVNVTINQEILDWADSLVDAHIFANRSHAVEAAVYWYREYLETGKLPPIVKQNANLK